jgi:hypothetical protein
VQKTTKAGSNGIVGTGVAGPSNSTSSTPFVYSKAHAQTIRERFCAVDYHGGPRSLRPRRVGHCYRRQDEDTEVPKCAPRVGGVPEGAKQWQAAGITLRLRCQCHVEKEGEPREPTAGALPKYELTYEPCHDRGYANGQLQEARLSASSEQGVQAIPQ